MSLQGQECQLCVCVCVCVCVEWACRDKSRLCVCVCVRVYVCVEWACRDKSAGPDRIVNYAGAGLHDLASAIL